MKIKPRILLLTLVLISLFNSELPGFAQGTTFTYQGRLNQNGSTANGIYDFRFRAAADAQGNNFIGSPSLTNGVPVTNGLFTAGVDFGPGIFNGAPLWLQIEVRTNGVGGYIGLFPPQSLTPSPYAIMAGSASNLLGSLPAAQLSGTLPVTTVSGTFTSAVTFNNAANNFSGNFTGNGGGLTGLWKLGGNGGTSASSSFLGTTDNQPLELKVNGVRALRLEPNTSGAPNIIGGSTNNFVAPGVVGASICGGGAGSYLFSGLFFSLTNEVLADFATVLGGYNNTASGFASVAMGGGSLASSNLCIAMGISTATGNRAIALGSSTASGDYSTALGNSIASGSGSTAVGNGYASGSTSFAASDSQATGDHATALGFTTSAGQCSFSAGQYARANHDGAFVWADRQNADFLSTGVNQFLIRAAGGVGIGTNHPASALHVVSAGNTPQVQITQTTTNNFSRLRMNVNPWPFWEIDVGSGATPSLSFWNVSPRVNIDYNGNISALSFTPTSDRNAKENFEPVNPRVVLAKVAALPLTRWNFKVDSATKHLGPMAQDFYAAFGVGPDDKHIATVDADGVALAAIQGLNQKLSEQETTLKKKDSEIQELQHAVAELEKTVRNIIGETRGQK